MFWVTSRCSCLKLVLQYWSTANVKMASLSKQRLMWCHARCNRCHELLVAIHTESEPSCTTCKPYTSRLDASTTCSAAESKKMKFISFDSVCGLFVNFLSQLSYISPSTVTSASNTAPFTHPCSNTVFMLLLVARSWHLYEAYVEREDVWHVW